MDSRITRLRCGILSWYDFVENPHILFIGDKTDGCIEIFRENTVLDIAEPECIPRTRERYDVIILTEVFEKNEHPAKIFEELRKLLREDGRFLLFANNRFGLRYFCGDTDPYTMHCLDSIDGYEKATLHGSNGYIGRMYSRNEIDSLLRAAGFKYNRFFAVLPGLNNAVFVYADGYTPNEDMNDRLYPEYNNPGTVFLEEETLYNSIMENGMLHFMANAFFVECSRDGRHTDVLQATCTAERDSILAMVTVIHGDGCVVKRALHNEGTQHIEKLSNNLEELKRRGIPTIPFSKKVDEIRMPYIKAETGQLYLKHLLYNDKNTFLKCFDRLCELVQMSSEIYTGEDGRRYFKKAYLDMVPLNSLWVDGDFIFFDQEFTVEDYPVKAVLARVVATFYGGNVALEKLLPAKELYQRYGLCEELNKWLSMEKDFLDTIRNEDELENYHRRTRRKDRTTDDNRKKISYSCAGWRAHEDNPLASMGGRRIVLFGSGRYAEKFIDLYGNIYNIEYIVDNAREKQGGKFHGIGIYDPERLKNISEHIYKVIVCIKDFMPVFAQLDNYGLRDYGLYKGESYLHKPHSDENSLKTYHIGYCAGAFDMFHIGHLNLLRRAKERCDYLIVGVMSDERMYDLKKKYPIIPCSERMQVVAGCRYVDQVEELPADRAGIMDAYNMFHFDCMFSGDDHAEDAGWLAERERLREHGSDIVFVSYTKETSSSEIRQRMKDDADRILQGDSRLLTDKNHRWIYTYDYAPCSVWEEWRDEVYGQINEEGTDSVETQTKNGTVPSWIADEADAVAGRQRCTGEDTDREDLSSYILLSDSHFAYNGTWDDTVASMRAVCDRMPVKGIIHLGDMTDGLLPLAETEKIEDKVMSDMNGLGIPVHVVPGNHDYNYFRGNTEVKYPEPSRYYVDDRSQKLRMCFIDSFDPKAGSRYGFTEDCIAWLGETLSEMSEGYKAIIFSHLTPLVRLQAWADDIRNRSKLIEVLDKHADKIMAFINGHNHCDHLFNDLKNGQFPIISINCAKCEYFLEHKPEGAEVPFRRLGDRTQESFDVMQVYTDKNEIYFTRFGAGRDRVVRNHKAEWM